MTVSDTGSSCLGLVAFQPTVQPYGDPWNRDIVRERPVIIVAGQLSIPQTNAVSAVH